MLAMMSVMLLIEILMNCAVWFMVGYTYRECREIEERNKK